MSIFSRGATAAAPSLARRKPARHISPSVSHLLHRELASRSLSSQPSFFLPPSTRSPLPSAGRRRPPPPPPSCRMPPAPHHHRAGWERPLLSSFSSSFPGRGGGTATTSVRAMSSYEWKNMSKQAQKANKDFGELSKEEIRKAGEKEIDKVETALKAMEPFNDVFEVRREGLEVFAELGPEVGEYWIKFDLSMYQICLMSPRSGPHRYIFDKESGRWIGEADSHDFQGMLTGDIIQSACGIPDF